MSESDDPELGRGRLEVDFRHRELRVDGEAVPVGGRAFDILQVLVEAAGSTVTKSELMGRVWSNSIVGDNALQVHVSAIRKALGADRALLKTLSGRGYRLLGRWTVRRGQDAARLDGPAPVPVPAELSASAPLTYRSGDCEIDLVQRELRVQGAPVPLGSRAFDLLAVLVEGANELVGRDRLIQRVWPGTPVKEGTIEFHISAMRKALGRHRTIIKTVSGRGYRLLGTWSRYRTVQPRPALSSLSGGGSTNLPASRIDLVGRDTSLEHLQQACSAYRLVTLTGTGGIGKTALGIELAHSLLPMFDGDACLVELASIAEPNLVPLAVAEALGLPTDRGTKSAESVARDIGARRLLLVLDNCEHVIDAATQLAESILRLSSRSVIVATSREMLRTTGEHVYRVPPLDVPSADSGATAEILRNSAVQLFLDRAEATQMAGLRDRLNLRLIAGICRHLDGMPLAIEFAAARAASLGLARVADGLQDRFALLTTGRRTALPRHQTLRAVLDWSYALLPDTERLLLHRLAIFSGGLTFDAACAVMPEHAPADVADGITSLVEKSVVNLEQAASGGRWRLLETVRSYALDKLTSAGDHAVTARRHAEHFRDFFATFDPNARQESASADLAPFTREVDNLRAALTWTYSASGDLHLGGRLVAAAVDFWLASSLLDECSSWIGKALPTIGDGDDLEQEMVLRNGLGQSLMFTEGMTSATQTNLTRALSLAEAIGSIEHQKRAVHGLWQISLRSVELRKALQFSRRYAAFARSGTDVAATRTANLMVGMSLTYLAEYVEASKLLEHAIHDHPPGQRQGEMASFGLDGLTSAFGHLSTCLLARGMVDASIRAAERSIEEAQQIGQPVALCLAMTRPAGLLFPEIGAFAKAERYVATILELADRHALHTFSALAACANGRVLFMRGDPASGAAALRSGLAQMEATGYRSLQTIFRGYFAEALTAAGNADEGLAQAEAALRFAEKTEYMRFVPELLCINGSVIAHSQPDNPKAERLLKRAINLSQRQEAWYWALRAALTLAEHWQKRGRPAEAYALLSPLYERFSEGLASPLSARTRKLLQAISDSRPLDPSH